MGIMVYSLLWGNAGFISSTVVKLDLLIRLGELMEVRGSLGGGTHLLTKPHKRKGHGFRVQGLGFNV